MKLLQRLQAHPLQKINYLELCFAFFAHVITFPILGVLTGLICGYAVHYAIGIQQDGNKPGTRQRAFYGVVVFKIAQTWMHQTSFAFILRFFGRTELPFGYDIDFWAWFATGLIFTVDIWALSTSAKQAAEAAEAAEIEASFARAAKHDEDERAARLERERLAIQERLETARIQAETKLQAKLAAEETARKIAEEQRKAAEVAAEIERTKVETEWKKAELQRKAEEDARNLAEARRKEEEAERKEQERQRKEEERQQRAEEARIRAESERAEKEAAAKAQAEIEAKRAMWREQKAKKSHHNGHQPETAINEAV